MVNLSAKQMRDGEWEFKLDFLFCKEIYGESDMIDSETWKSYDI